MLKVSEDDQNAMDARCADLARKGALSGANTKGCMPPPRPGRTPEEIAYLRQPYLRAGYYEATRSESNSLGREGSGDSADFRQERAAQRSFDATPVVVLTRDPDGPHPPGVSEERIRASEAEWMAGHDRLAARSTRGRNTVVPGAGHMIQIEKPDAVVSAVTEVVQEARRR